MTDRPIIFSGPMIRALLDGRKTQTRRVIKLDGRRPEFCGPRGCEADPTCWGWEDSDHGDWVTLEGEPGQRMCWRDWRGAYAPGDRLWVREAFTEIPMIGPRYYATNEIPASFKKVSPIHMPRWASRLTLTVTDVRVQRVQEISAEDSVAEGVQCGTCEAMNQSACHGRGCFASIDAFRDLWNSIHGPGAWDANNWVAAISFTVECRNIDAVAG